MGNRGAGQGGNLGNLAHIEPLPLLEQEQDALPMLIPQGRENPGHGLPFRRESTGVVGFHVDDLSYIDAFMQEVFCTGVSAAA